LARTWVHFKFGAVHSDLILVASKRLHRWSSSSISSYFFLSSHSGSSLVLSVCCTNAHFKLSLEWRKVPEESHQVNLHDGVGRDVRGFLLEATVHENGGVDSPDGVAEPLQAVELVPLATFSLVDFQLDVLAHSVGAAAHDHHHCSHEDACVLVPSERLFRANFVGSLDPVPAAISVTAQAPGVLQGRLVGSTPTESDHHTRGGACCAKRRRMVGSHTRFVLTCHP